GLILLGKGRRRGRGREVYRPRDGGVPVVLRGHLRARLRQRERAASPAARDVLLLPADDVVSPDLGAARVLAHGQVRGRGRSRVGGLGGWRAAVAILAEGPNLRRQSR